MGDENLSEIVFFFPSSIDVRWMNECMKFMLCICEDRSESLGMRELLC